MPLFEPITDPEEVARWSAMRARLFTPMDGPEYQKATISPFKDSSWPVIPIVDKFRGYIFEEGEGAESGGWPERASRGLPDIESYCDPLIWCFRKRQCREIIVCYEWESPVPQDVDPPVVLYGRCDVSTDGINAAYKFFMKEESRVHYQREFEPPSLRAFDATGEWAVADAYEEAHFVGGEPAFMEQFFEAAGGEDYLRAWHYHYDLWSLTVMDHGQFYDLAGWPRPIPPKKGLVYGIGADIDWSPMFGDRITSCGPDTRTPDWPS